MAKSAAIFLDRDGTLVEDVGFISNPSQVMFFPFTVEALKMLQPHFRLFIVTNQSGIAKGNVTVDEVERVNAFIEEHLRNQGVTIEQTYYCPHNAEDGCSCKKPSPYFINKAVSLFDIDLSQSFMVGDHPSDVEFGRNAGVKSVYLLSGHGQKHREELKGDETVLGNILDASHFILSTVKNEKHE
ncbi:MAG TPA: HAD family hydrolase [Tenuifilaceae bacterium]|nr:HAD family hydrolase [Tenuifilaceae bacterium]HQB77257.1 HAD family hydrolase [Tenuifilaceae bacterium]